MDLSSHIKALSRFPLRTQFRTPSSFRRGFSSPSAALLGLALLPHSGGAPRAGTVRLAPPGGCARLCSGCAPRPAPPRPSLGGPAGGGVAAAAASTAARVVGAQAPEQDGDASTARPRSGLGWRSPAAGRPLQPPARAPVSSAALSGSGRGVAAAGRRARGPPARVSAPARQRSLGQGRRGCGAARAEAAVGRGGREPRRSRSAFPAFRAQGHGGDGARCQGHVRAPCGPGLRDLDPARPERWPRARARLRPQALDSASGFSRAPGQGCASAQSHGVCPCSLRW